MGGLLEEDLHSGTGEIVSVPLGTALTDLVVVRARVRELLLGYPADIVADAVLVADALASNAYDHGDDPKVVRLVLLNGGACLRIEADDGSVFELPEVRGWTGTGGLGMVVVSQVATSWGVERRPGRKTVWAELTLVNPRY